MSDYYKALDEASEKAERQERDKELALIILRTLAIADSASIRIQRFDRGFGGQMTLDTDWLPLTDEELDLLDRLKAEGL